MNNIIIDMITCVTEDDDHCIRVVLKAGGDQARNQHREESYPCLAAYWHERLLKKDRAS
jgi:hypothetical protein